LFNILIVEDNIYQRENLIGMINELGEEYKIFEADCEEVALEIADKNVIDIFFVDIGLRNSSGLEFAKKIRADRRYEIAWIVFITTHLEYMTEAFKKLHCYDFITKPYRKEEIKETILKLLKNKEKNNDKKVERKCVVFKSDGIYMKIFADEIIFIEIRFRKTTIHTKRAEIEVNNIPLSKMKETFEFTNIKQFHRSFLINLDYITKVDKMKSTCEVYFKDYQKTAQVSRSYIKKFEDAFKNS
jgi:DNA-binding LytR/AlgR family response regulator